VHSCAHALSTVLDMHHGLANGIMIDHVMRFNLTAAADKFAELAHVARVHGGDTGSAEARGRAFIDWLPPLLPGSDPRLPGIVRFGSLAKVIAGHARNKNPVS